MFHLSRKDLSASYKLDGRVDVEKPRWINQRPCVPFELRVVPLSAKKPIYLPSTQYGTIKRIRKESSPPTKILTFLDTLNKIRNSRPPEACKRKDHL